ncbi:unnamed protein product [Sphacelaria rigidula]
MSRDHYRVLGVPPNAKQQDVRAAYLRLAKQHHPDICKASGNADHFKAINSAWEVLGNKSKRAMYDANMGDTSSFRTRPRPRPTSAWDARARAWGPSYGGGRDMPVILRIWERVTHPRTLLWGVPIAMVGFLAFGATEKEQKFTPKVRAWHNPVTMRWETPAPWDPVFREHQHLVKKVDKDLVHQSSQRERRR